MDYALASVRLCWGTQLEITSGCFIELWSPEWAEALPFGAKVPTRPSYCHPWSSGVTHWLTEAHLGLSPLTPGFGVALMAPHVSRANPHVSGTRDTPYGKLRLTASRQSQVGARETTVKLELDTPVVTVVATPHARSDGCEELIGFRRTGDAEIAVQLSHSEVAHHLHSAGHTTTNPPHSSVDATLGRLHRDVASSLGYSHPTITA